MIQRCERSGLDGGRPGRRGRLDGSGTRVPSGGPVTPGMNAEVVVHLEPAAIGQRVEDAL